MDHEMELSVMPNALKDILLIQGVELGKKISHKLSQNG